MGNKLAVVSWPSSREDNRIRVKLAELATVHNLAKSEQPLGLDRGTTKFAVDISGLSILVRKEQILDDFLNAATAMIWREFRIVARGTRESLLI